MSKEEILEVFRELPFEEQLEVLQQTRVEFAHILPPVLATRIERRAEWFRTHPEYGPTWEKVRAKLAGKPAS